MIGVKKSVMLLSFNDFKNIVEQYSNKNNANFDTQMETMVTMSLQSKLNK